MKKLLFKLINLIRHNVMHIDDRTPVQVAIDNGMTVGEGFECKEGCILDPGHVWLITIGDNVTLAPRVHLLAHDASTKHSLGYTKIAPVNIGSNCFIGANSTVMPGVTIGDNCIVGANSVVTKDIPSGTVCVGNPAHAISSTADYIEKNRLAMETHPKYGKEFIIGSITPEMKEQMKAELKESGFGYIV